MTTFLQPRKPLDGESFQVLVIGGGINGVAIARECARAGQRTLLVEQHDFAAGTTSRSTRIIHGGLRYLEQGDVGQVRDSLRERQQLLRDYPNLVRPLRFLLALDGDSRRSALAVRAGLWLYRCLGAGKSQGWSQNEQRDFERLLDAGRRWSILDFEDAQCEFPERLVAEWLREATQAGAAARNYTEVLTIDIQNGRATGALLRDRVTGKEERVGATWIINATGPWADQLCQSSGIVTRQPMIGGVRGSHIVLPRFPGAPDAAVYAEALDGRPIFVIPWNGQILAGSTEVPDGGDPGRVEPSAEEITYLLRSLLRLFPSINISQDNIRYAFAGVRPLSFSPDANPSVITRRHYLRDHAEDGAAQVVSANGGKLTTAAQLARECVAKIGVVPAARPGLAVAGETDCGSLLDRWALEIAQIGGISSRSASAIVEWHGRRSWAIADRARGRAEWRVPLCSHSEHIVAEAVDAFANECAVTLADVLLRRVPVALGPCWSSDCSREAAARVGAAMGWDDEQSAAQLEAFEAERNGFLRKAVAAGA
jgi:glycerol-3-phosphate dehydrogenase